jgi:hypothetical protein
MFFHGITYLTDSCYAFAPKNSVIEHQFIVIRNTVCHKIQMVILFFCSPKKAAKKGVLFSSGFVRRAVVFA